MKKRTILTTLAIFLFLLVGCGNKISLKLADTSVVANEKGKVIIKGTVSGKGTLHVNSNDVDAIVSKDGDFEFEYTLTDPSIDEVVKVDYVNNKNKKDKVTKGIEVKANSTAIENKKKEDEKKRIEDEKKEKERAKQDEENRKAEEKKQKEEAAKKKAEEAKYKKAGYSFTISGDANEEGKRVITKYEAGMYTIKCTFVPEPQNFEQFPDYDDLTGYVTIFSEKGHDMTGELDLALHDLQLTSDLYLKDVNNNHLENVKTEAKYIELKEGYEVQALNCTINLVKE